jgi:hypothetical protein
MILCIRIENSSDGQNLEHLPLKRGFLRRMVEFFEGEGRTFILLAHLPILDFLKHLVFFSVDTVEKDGFVVEKNKNRSGASMAHPPIHSIEKV